MDSNTRDVYAELLMRDTRKYFESLTGMSEEEKKKLGKEFYNRRLDYYVSLALTEANLKEEN